MVVKDSRDEGEKELAEEGSARGRQTEGEKAEVREKATTAPTKTVRATAEREQAEKVVREQAVLDKARMTDDLIAMCAARDAEKSSERRTDLEAQCRTLARQIAAYDRLRAS